MNLFSIPVTAVRVGFRVARLPLDVARSVLPGGSRPGDRERQRAEELRRQAAERTAEADAKLRERREQAAERRSSADASAEARKRQAAEEREVRQESARQVESTRRQSSRKAENERAAEIAAEAPKGRLEVLDAVEDAQENREQALTERDEAERLAGAAARAKEERKS